MSLNKGKHIVEEIDGVRCSIVETGVTSERVDFLKKLLEHNSYMVKVAPGKEDGLFIIGVTDLIFNPVIDIYKRQLKSFTDKKVTPAFWLQLSDNETEKEVNYWNY